jgi:hypothetical protein
MNDMKKPEKTRNQKIFELGPYCTNFFFEDEGLTDVGTLLLGVFLKVIIQLFLLFMEVFLDFT